jgi:hypothetical protein
MKQIIILAMLLTATLSYSQIYTSSYEPRTMDYHMARAQVSAEQINKNVEVLANKVLDALKLERDNQFKQDMADIMPYLKLLLGDKPMSVIDAEGYYNQADKMYDEAVKNYYKRLNRR